MRINRLRLSNFRQHVDTRIEFEAGITGVIGPNGSGKSTLLEAIAWALYGMPAARGTRESIRSYRAAPRATVKVELEFELGSHRYLVSRGLTNAELYLDGSTVPIATSLSAVSDLLRRRLGMSHEEFFNTYFTGQKELGVMAAMGPAERAQFLSRVLGYERLRAAQELVRNRRRSVESESKGLRAGMPDAEVVLAAVADAEARVAGAEARLTAARARRDQAHRALGDITPRWESMQRERDELQAVVAELGVVEADRTARERDLTRIERECADIILARQTYDELTAQLAPLAALQAESAVLERAYNEEARRRTLSDSVRVLAEELQRLADRRTEIETAPSLETKAVETLARLRAELLAAQAQFEAAQTDWVRDKQEAETKRQALLDQLRDTKQQREQIVELGENGTCPICARPLGTHLREVLDTIDQQIETITVDGKYYRARIEQLSAMPPEVATLDERRAHLLEQVGKADRRLVTVKAAVQELKQLVADMEVKHQRRDVLTKELATIAVSYDASRHAEIKTLVQRLTPLAARATKLSVQLEREPRLVEERDRVQIALATVQLRAAELGAQRALIAFSEESFGVMRAAYEQAATVLRDAEIAAVKVDADNATAKAALDGANQARADLARSEARLAELTREHRLHDELDRAFGEIRTDLNQELRPELSDRASRYIRELTDGRYSEIELDDQYNIIVLEDGIPKPVISGGEEDLANLVLRLAISEMIAERAGQAFSLLILDEVFGSLDETRRHNVVDLLRRLQDRFEQVILITHIESVREGLDRVVSLRYDEESGASRMDTELLSAAPLFDVQAGAAD